MANRLPDPESPAAPASAPEESGAPVDPQHLALLTYLLQAQEAVDDDQAPELEPLEPDLPLGVAVLP